MAAKVLRLRKGTPFTLMYLCVEIANGHQFDKIKADRVLFSKNSLLDDIPRPPMEMPLIQPDEFEYAHLAFYLHSTTAMNHRVVT